jgi:hypothetical protein
LRVDRQFVADPLRDVPACSLVAVLCLIEPIEEFLDGAVIRHEKLERERLPAQVATFRPCHDVLLANLGVALAVKRSRCKGSRHDSSGSPRGTESIRRVPNPFIGETKCTLAHRSSH